MTVYLWIPVNNGIEGVLAADKRQITKIRRERRRKTRGKVTKKAIKKIKIVNSNIATVCSGPQQYIDPFNDLVKQNKGDPLDFYLHFEKRVKGLFNRTRPTSSFSYFILFAGIPGEDSIKAYIASAHSKRRIEVLEVPGIIAGGSGRTQARQYVSLHWKPELNLDQTVDLAYQAIEQANRTLESCKHVEIITATMQGFTYQDISQVRQLRIAQCNMD